MPARRAHRDLRGTNQIQAIDLVVRNWWPTAGAPSKLRLETLAIVAAAAEARYAQAAAGQLQALAALSRAVVAASRDDAELPFRVADDLRATALALIAHWARAGRCRRGRRRRRYLPRR